MALLGTSVPKTIGRDSFLASLFLLKPTKVKVAKSVFWSPPQYGLYMLNTNASVFGSSDSGGWLVRDYNGKVCFPFYEEFGDRDVLQAQACALSFGLRLSLDHELQGVSAEVDSQILFTWYHQIHMFDGLYATS